MPIVLEKASKVGKLLADEADRIDLPAVGVSKQERGKGVTALVRVGAVGPPGFGIAESKTAGYAWPAEAVVMIDLKRAAELETMRAMYPGKVVVVRIDGVFGSVWSQIGRTPSWRDCWLPGRTIVRRSQ